MIKFLIIAFLVGYVLFKVLGFLFKILFLGATSQQRHATGKQQRRAKDGNVNIDYTSAQNDKGFKGGEYVDYEEIKD